MRAGNRARVNRDTADCELGMGTQRIMNEPHRRVMHVISGDLWAGAEVQAYTLLTQLHHDCELHVAVMNLGRLQQQLQNAGIAVTVLDESRLNSLAILRKLRQLMREFQPHIIHTHRQKEHILGALANLLSVRVACVRTSHGAPEFEPKGRQRLQVWADRLTGRYLQDAVIAVSADLAEQLRRYFPKQRIHVIHNGIDVSALTRQAAEADFRRADAQSVHIGIVGRLEPVKRVDLFLEMAPIIMEQFCDRQFCFHVIGDGRLRATLQRQADELGLGDRVRFHGHRDDIPTCLRSLDLLIMCSDHEGTPMTALESLALRTAIIAHDVGGLREVLADYPELRVQDHCAAGYARQVRRYLTRESSLDIVLNQRYHAAANGLATRQLYDRLLHTRLAKLGIE